MTDKTHAKIRTEDKEILDELREDPEIRKKAVEAGIIEENSPYFGYGHVMQLLIPDDAEEMSIETEPVRMAGMVERLHELAGTSVRIHDVVHRYVKEYKEEQNE